MGSWNLFSRNKSAVAGSTRWNRTAEYQARLKQYNLVWEAYFAELPDPIKVENNINDNVKVNPARAIIDTGVYFLFGRSVGFKVHPEESQKKNKPSSKKPSAPKAAKPTFGSEKPAFGSEKPENDRPFDDGGPKRKTPFGDPSEGRKDPDYDPETVEDEGDPEWMVKLNKCWKANRKESLLNKMGLMGALTGDVFIKFIPKGAGRKKDMPRLVLLDTHNVDVETDPNDVDQVIKYSIRYVVEDDKGEPRKTMIQEITPVYSEDEWGYMDITSWEIKDYEHDWAWSVSQSAWMPDSTTNPIQVGETKKWEYEWPPIEHCPNLEIPCMFWGLADLDESSVEVLQSLQRSMSTLNKIVRLHSSPRLFAKNVQPDMLSEIDMSPENIIALPGIDTDLTVLQILDNLSSAIEFTRELKSDLLEMVRVPKIALGDFDDASSAASGINMSILYAPIIQKTEQKRITYGDMLIRICLKLLELMDVEIDDDMEDMCVDWPEAMPGSKYLERQTLEQDLAMGVSEHTIVKKLGYNPDEELARNNAKMEHEKAMNTQYDMQANAARFGDQTMMQQQRQEQRGGNNNPSGKGNKSGSTGAYGNSTPKQK